MTTGTVAVCHVGYGSSDVTTPSARHTSTNFWQWASPYNCTSSFDVVHNSWLPSTQITFMNRVDSKAKDFSTWEKVLSED